LYIFYFIPYFSSQFTYLRRYAIILLLLGFLNSISQRTIFFSPRLPCYPSRKFGSAKVQPFFILTNIFLTFFENIF